MTHLGPWLPLTLAALVACSGDEASNDGPSQGIDPDEISESGPTDTFDSGTSEPDPHFPTSVIDLAPSSGLDPVSGGERTRAMVAADFDNDGLDDLFVGNPGDASYVLRNLSTPGSPQFEVVQELSRGHLSWTAAAADFDNDGDVDLYVGGGGNECDALDQLWKNQLVETGTLSFVQARVSLGLTVVRYGFPPAHDRIATTGVRWFDANNDGWLDLYLTHNAEPRCGNTLGDITEANELWLNIEGERFERLSTEAGLGGGASTRHPSILDYDDDGDFDIFDSNLRGANMLYRNLFVETGEVVFGHVDLSATGDDVTYPDKAFASCAADLDNDGLDDLIVLNRAAPECVVATDSTTGSTLAGYYHGVYRNHGAEGFVDQTAEAGLLVTVSNLRNGVMGCQVGDLNGDGVIDVFVGNGGPWSAGRDDLYLGEPTSTAFHDTSRSIRTYPGETVAYRTHGTVITDLDGDGRPDMLVGNGGPSAFADVEEPNQLLQFEWNHAAEFLGVKLSGDGEHVNRDAIGARVELVFTLSDGSTRSVHRTVRGGSCFSADNGRTLHFGLHRGATSLEAGDPTLLRIRWPDGTRSDHPVEGAGTPVHITYEP